MTVTSNEISKKDIRKLYNLSETVQYCTRCVVSNQRPRIVFDEDGVCNACRYAERKQTRIDWKKREDELLKTLDRFRRNDGEYDVLVPASGGKDSTFVAWELKNKYGMHPLTVTWSPNIYTDIGLQNLRAFIDSGFNNVSGIPDGKINRRLVRLSFEELGEPFQPFIYGQCAFPLRVAVTHGIKLIMDGENGEVEYGGDESCEKPGFSAEDELKYWYSGVSAARWLDYGFTKQELYCYMPPSVEEVQGKQIERHFYSYYKNWLPQENYYLAAEKAGFQANPDGRSEGTYSKYASLDDRIDGFHYFLMFLKFGIGRATSDAAHEIRDGHLTREEGVALVRRYDGEFPKKYFEDFLEYTGITEEHFWNVADSWRASHLWNKEGEEWKLGVQVSEC